jgi:DNA repair photolyase
LHPTPLSGAADVPGLDLAGGCVHLVPDLAERLDEELRNGPAPRAVFISPDQDPFPSSAAVQHETGRVVQVLARHGVEAWLMTRGRIRPALRALLEEHRARVKVTVALNTLSERIQCALEPGTASPEERLEQIRDLKERGITVQVSLDPLVPGWTDSRDHLADLVGALADVGVQQVTAGYLFLREDIAERLRSQLGEQGEAVVRAFTGGPVLRAPGQPSARYLPRGRRQRGYATLMALAAERQMRVSVAAWSNPDFQPQAALPATPRTSLREMFLARVQEVAGAE